MKKRGLYRFGQVVVPPIFKLLYWYKVIGRENVPAEGPLLFCSNHTTYKDPLFMGLIQKRQVWFMAKKELFKNKFLSMLLTWLGVFPVERSGGISAINRGIRILQQNGIVGIFIEGTRSKNGELLKPKPGVVLLARETDATIIPMAIVGKEGKRPRLFSKTVINVGKPITFESLGMKDATGVEMRKASRLIMERIKELRDEVLKGEVS